ncbi:MAG: isoprenyl transferase [Desulfarculus sp.]|nr:isoprenyl transferase [Desulfarculus sp.]
MKPPPAPKQAPGEPDPAALPRHLAIIMDGNGRWAKERGWRRVRGHEEGAESVRVAVRACRRLGLAALTLYAFSEENWGRPPVEVSALMTLLNRFLKKERQEMLDQGIRLNAIGELDKLPQATRDLLAKTMADTAQGQHMTLTLALSYGGRQEIVQAARALAHQAVAGELDPEEIGEATLAAHLYTAGLPEVDLLIRTSGELRVSNFLLWQIAYSEFHFTDVYWPEFREPHLLAALHDYARRQRRFGKTGEQVRGQGG